MNNMRKIYYIKEERFSDGVPYTILSDHFAFFNHALKELKKYLIKMKTTGVFNAECNKLSIVSGIINSDTGECYISLSPARKEIIIRADERAPVSYAANELFNSLLPEKQRGFHPNYNNAPKMITEADKIVSNPVMCKKVIKNINKKYNSKTMGKYFIHEYLQDRENYLNTCVTINKELESIRCELDKISTYIE